MGAASPFRIFLHTTLIPFKTLGDWHPASTVVHVSSLLKPSCGAAMRARQCSLPFLNWPLAFKLSLIRPTIIKFVKCHALLTTYSVWVPTECRRNGQTTPVHKYITSWLVVLNFTYSLASMPVLQDGAFWLAMHRYMYHRTFLTDYEDHPVHWFLYDAVAVSRKACDHNVPLYIVDKVCEDLYLWNYLYHAYESFACYKPHEQQVHMELSLADPDHGDEVATLYHVGSAPWPSPHCLCVQRTSLDNEPKGIRIPILHALYEPLQYLLLFPQGMRGWGLDMWALNWTQCKYYKYCLLTEPPFQEFSRLGCEYICDVFSWMEDERLDFVWRGKASETVRLRELAHDQDFMLDDSEDDNEDLNNDCTNLLASFTGSLKYFANRTANALVLSHQHRKPDFLIMARCNPNWPELLEQLQPGQSATEVPHITVCIFKVSNILHNVYLILSIMFKGTSPQAHEGNQRSIWPWLPHLCNWIPEVWPPACTYCYQSKWFQCCSNVIFQLKLPSKLCCNLRIEDINLIISAQIPSEPGPLLPVLDIVGTPPPSQSIHTCM